MIKKYTYYSKIAYDASGFYIVNYLLGIFSDIIMLFCFYYLWRNVYSTNVQTINGFSVNSMITYVIMSRIIAKVYIADIGDLIGDKVMTGDVVLDLVKPNHPLIALTMQNAGSSFFQLIRVCLPLYIVSVFIFKISIPGMSVWLSFIPSLILSYFMYTLFGLLVGVIGFYSQAVRGLNFLKIVVISLFSGAYMPIDLFPEVLKKVADVLPFQGMFYLPLQIYLGQSTKEQILEVYLEQVLWIGLLFMAIHLLWSNAKERLIVKGG